jgi:hypothetical protein
MEEFLDLVYKKYSIRGVDSFLNKSKEILQDLVDGEEILDFATYERDLDFATYSPDLTKKICQNLTKGRVKEFFQSKEGYARSLKPSTQIYRGLAVKDRLIKFEMDLIDIRFLNLEQYNYILTIIDVFSKYAFIIPLKNKEGALVAKKLDQLFSLPSLKLEMLETKPKILHSDNGSEFINKLARKVCKFHNVFQTFSKPYHPLGIIERFNQTIKRKIKRRNAENTFPHEKEQILRVLKRLLTEYKTTKHNTTGYPPIFVHFTKDEKVIEKVRERIANMLFRRQLKQEERLKGFKVGDVVRVLNVNDPTKSLAERNAIRKKFRFNPYFIRYWSKDHFEIQEVARGERKSGERYILRDFPDLKFKPTQLQKVKK